MGWCYMCKKSGELVDHSLLYCKVASVLWDAIFTTSILAWVMPRRVVYLFDCWRGVRGDSHAVTVWNLFLYASCGEFDFNGMTEALNIESALWKK